jgi:PKD repeat protein
MSTPVAAAGNFTDPGTGDTHTGTFDWGDGTSSAAGVTEANGAGSASGTHTYAAAGSYTVTLRVADDDGGSSSSQSAPLVVYDPHAGLVAGLGWINSPVVPSLRYMTVSGRAGFAFASKYQNGSTVPVGVTGFTFLARNVVFTSASYEWLVVAGARAQFQGFGKINGSGNFGFLLTAIDGAIPGGGSVDRFRMKIWDRRNPADPNDDVLVYDNQYGAATGAAALGGGSIVISTE